MVQTRFGSQDDPRFRNRRAPALAEGTDCLVELVRVATGNPEQVVVPAGYEDDLADALERPGLLFERLRGRAGQQSDVDDGVKTPSQPCEIECGGEAGDRAGSYQAPNALANRVCAKSDGAAELGKADATILNKVLDDQVVKSVKRI